MTETVPATPSTLGQLTDTEFLAKLAEVERVGTVHAGVTSMVLAHEMSTRLRERNEAIETLQREITHLRTTRPNTAQMTMEHRTIVNNLSDRLHRAEGCLRFALLSHPIVQLKQTSLSRISSEDEFKRMMARTMKEWEECLRRVLRYFNHYKDARPNRDGDFTAEVPDYENLLAALPAELRPRFKATLLTCGLLGAIPEYKGTVAQQTGPILHRAWDDLVKVFRAAQRDGVSA